MPYTTCLVLDDFNLAEARAENVRFAFRFDLPFRLRIGSNFAHDFTVRGRKVQLHARNQVAIPEGTQLHQLLREYSDFQQLRTQAIILVLNPDVSDESLHALRESTPDSEEFKYPSASGELFTAIQAMNDFVIAYATATGQLFGGTPLKLFRATDLTDPVRWQLTIVGPTEELSNDDIETVFSRTAECEIPRVQTIRGDLFDLQSDQIDEIDKAFKRHAEFVFYEYAFEAKSKMFAHDYVGALLMAVAALEGAHGAFVQDAIITRLPQSAKPRLKAKLAEDYIRELGMSLCIQLTPYILMDEDDRPSPEVIRSAQKGLEYRNAIMHASRNKGGDYRIRLRTDTELCNAYSAVLDVYDCYRKAFERIMDTNVSEGCT